MATFNTLLKTTGALALMASAGAHPALAQTDAADRFVAEAMVPHLTASPRSPGEPGGPAARSAASAADQFIAAVLIPRHASVAAAHDPIGTLDAGERSAFSEFIDQVLLPTASRQAARLPADIAARSH